MWQQKKSLCQRGVNVAVGDECGSERCMWQHEVNVAAVDGCVGERVIMAAGRVNVATEGGCGSKG